MRLKMVMSISKDHMRVARSLADRYGWYLKVRDGVIELLEAEEDEDRD